MFRSRWIRWGVVLGVALGGFFDGILLHQILQWHHLLSLVPAAGDLRWQVMWDGYFHALMYLLAALALWQLWRAHRAVDGGWGWQLGGALLLGFGLWHLTDSVLSHWLLGIHRIRVDSSSPLLWDLIWFVVFGVVPGAIGWVLLKRRGGGAGLTLSGAAKAVLLLGLVTTGAGAWALRPPQAQPFTTVVFAPGIDGAAIIAALSAVDPDGRLVWSDRDGGVAVVEIAPARRWAFYRHGALLVSGAGLPAGCFDWSRV